jgi:hypothetical protein
MNMFMTLLGFKRCPKCCRWHKDHDSFCGLGCRRDYQLAYEVSMFISQF